ncbi:WD domain, G-beta repeat [Carpediemonas membranifera]|uniref:WD domain, G-beta repeat n=1 Tax=Carpediemonas membranifera TaxID=201153 RepID=A0A8J6B199_9EUKA|nr:WD domain, G-beta repeat [Carpediemonas membranifera]|eukprot:KAG9390887.1 WD domain, G-beta repeat [Carpediemonas membranifera]
MNGIQPLTPGLSLLNRFQPSNLFRLRLIASYHPELSQFTILDEKGVIKYIDRKPAVEKRILSFAVGRKYISHMCYDSTHHGYWAVTHTLQVIFFDTDFYRPVLELDGQMRSILAIRWIPERQFLLLAGVDGVTIWHIPPDPLYVYKAVPPEEEIYIPVVIKDILDDHPRSLTDSMLRGLPLLTSVVPQSTLRFQIPTNKWGWASVLDYTLDKPDAGDLLVIACDTHVLSFRLHLDGWSWDVSCVMEDCHVNRITSVVRNPTNSTVITTSTDGTAKVWFDSGVLQHTFEGHQRPIIGACLVRNTAPSQSALEEAAPMALLTASEDCTVRLWCLHTKEPLYRISLQGPALGLIPVDVMGAGLAGRYRAANRDNVTDRITPPVVLVATEGGVDAICPRLSLFLNLQIRCAAVNVGRSLCMTSPYEPGSKGEPLTLFLSSDNVVRVLNKRGDVLADVLIPPILARTAHHPTAPVLFAVTENGRLISTQVTVSDVQHQGSKRKLGGPTVDIKEAVCDPSIDHTCLNFAHVVESDILTTFVTPQAPDRPRFSTTSDTRQSFLLAGTTLGGVDVFAPYNVTAPRKAARAGRNRKSAMNLSSDIDLTSPVRTLRCEDLKDTRVSLVRFMSSMNTVIAVGGGMLCALSLPTGRSTGTRVGGVAMMTIYNDQVILGAKDGGVSVYAYTGSAFHLVSTRLTDPEPVIAVDSHLALRLVLSACRGGTIRLWAVRRDTPVDDGLAFDNIQPLIDIHLCPDLTAASFLNLDGDILVCWRRDMYIIPATHWKGKVQVSAGPTDQYFSMLELPRLSLPLGGPASNLVMQAALLTGRKTKRSARRRASILDHYKHKVHARNLEVVKTATATEASQPGTAQQTPRDGPGLSSSDDDLSDRPADVLDEEDSDEYELETSMSEGDSSDGEWTAADLIDQIRLGLKSRKKRKPVDRAVKKSIFGRASPARTTDQLDGQTAAVRRAEIWTDSDSRTVTLDDNDRTYRQYVLRQALQNLEEINATVNEQCRQELLEKERLRLSRIPEFMALLDDARRARGVDLIHSLETDRLTALLAVEAIGRPPGSGDDDMPPTKSDVTLQDVSRPQLVPVTAEGETPTSTQGSAETSRRSSVLSVKLLPADKGNEPTSLEALLASYDEMASNPPSPKRKPKHKRKPKSHSRSVSSISETPDTKLATDKNDKPKSADIQPALIEHAPPIPEHKPPKRRPTVLKPVDVQRKKKDPVRFVLSDKPKTSAISVVPDSRMSAVLVYEPEDVGSADDLLSIGQQLSAARAAHDLLEQTANSYNSSPTQPDGPSGQHQRQLSLNDMTPALGLVPKAAQQGAGVANKAKHSYATAPADVHANTPTVDGLSLTQSRAVMQNLSETAGLAEFKAANEVAPLFPTKRHHEIRGRFDFVKPPVDPNQRVYRVSQPKVPENKAPTTVDRASVIAMLRRAHDHRPPPKDRVGPLGLNSSMSRGRTPPKQPVDPVPLTVSEAGSTLDELLALDHGTIAEFMELLGQLDIGCRTAFRTALAMFTPGEPALSATKVLQQIRESRNKFMMGNSATPGLKQVQAIVSYISSISPELLETVRDAASGGLTRDYRRKPVPVDVLRG